MNFQEFKHLPQAEKKRTYMCAYTHPPKLNHMWYLFLIRLCYPVEGTARQGALGG